MSSQCNRLALGGALTGVVMLLCTQAVLAQVPAALPAAPAFPQNGTEPPDFLPTQPQSGSSLPNSLPGMPTPPGTAIQLPTLGGPVNAQPTPGYPGGAAGMGAGTSPTGPPAAAPTDPTKSPFSMSWNQQNGLNFASANKWFTLHSGATVQYDFAWYSASPILELGPGGTRKFNDGANLRRARMFFEGTLYQAVDYKFELEFMNGIGFSPVGTTNEAVAGSVTNSPGPTDAWMNIKDVPLVGNIRIGSQKEWFSLEHLNSYRYLEFLERSYLFDFAQPTAFNNGFSPGISLFRTWLDDLIFSGVGVYKNESDLLGFGVGDGQYAVTGRLAALLVWSPDDHLFWHLGGAMSHRDPVNGQVQVRVRDNIRNAPFPLLPLVINTGLLNASSQDLFNIETAAVWGPLTFQAEYTANVIRGASTAATAAAPAGPALGDLFFQGYYAEGMWLLTGESRTWNTKNFFFNRVIPKHPLRLKPTDCESYGFGAWELAARFSHLDVSNSAIKAGVLDSVTLGLNWYLNVNAKLQFNYDYTQRHNSATAAQGHIHAFGIRSAFDF